MRHSYTGCCVPVESQCMIHTAAHIALPPGFHSIPLNHQEKLAMGQQQMSHLPAVNMTVMEAF